jgi:hypothetical protein
VRALLAERFVRSFVAAPPELQRAFGKQLAHLLRDLRHRSLDAKDDIPFMPWLRHRSFLKNVLGIHYDVIMIGGAIVFLLWWLGILLGIVQ